MLSFLHHLVLLNWIEGGDEVTKEDCREAGDGGGCFPDVGTDAVL